MSSPSSAARRWSPFP